MTPLTSTERSARHRSRNPDTVRLARRRYKTGHVARMRVIEVEAKNRPCADCGRSYPPYVMDFDHVRGEKVANVSVLVAGGASRRRVLAEIAKCEVVCANCHRERTHGRQA